VNLGAAADLLIAASSAAALIASLTAAGRWLARISRKITSLHDAWYGTPPAPGVPARPGVLERLAAQETHLAAQDRHLAGQDDHLAAQDAELAAIRREVENLRAHLTGGP